VVGDPSQTIYSFTGASPRHLLDFTARHPGATTVRLVRDYRSTPQVVGLANSLLAKARGTSAGARLQLLAQRPAGPDPTLTAHDDDLAEAAAVAKRIKQLIADGTRPSEIAVLYRTNAQSEPVEQALADAGVPYLVRGGERFFARKEIRDAILLLRGAARGGRAAASPPAGDADRSAEEPVDGRLDGLGEETRAVLSSAGWSAVPPSTGGAVRERWESLQALAALADEIAVQNPTAGLADLVAELEERAAARHAPTVEGVTLASLHSAKGLEWDAVLLVGLSEGLMPISFADGTDAVEEERRLLYVGITRFLEGLLGSPEAHSRKPTGADGSRQRRTRAAGLPTVCRVCATGLSAPAERKVGRCSTCPPTYDEELFEQLRSWRATTAAEAKVPAYVVFTDATLVAIAETLPADNGALARVPGVGPTKLERYGEAVRGMLAGR
jgi:DNA helicase-2/ATP-dependent DNA helicase PcrA